MNYELAKELKEAGFPEVMDYGQWFFSGDGNRHGYFSFHEGFKLPIDYIKDPTLSELIEACGEPFRWLKHIPKGKPDQKWMAQGRPHWKDENGKGLKEPRCHGSIPEEAVARLWLALNTK